MIPLRSAGAVLRGACIGLVFGAVFPGPARAFTPEQAKAPMTVTLVRSDDKVCGTDCPEWLSMKGRIGFETVGRLQAALARLGSRRVPVFVDSPGGESKAGLALGQMIRAHRLDVVVAGTTLTDCAAADRLCLDRLRAGLHPGSLSLGVAACASACVFVLAGGVERTVPPGSYVGVHQAKQVQTFHRFINTFRILKRMQGGHAVEISRTLVATRPLPAKVVVSAAPETLYSEFDHFLIRMGIDESIMPLIRATPPSGIHWMTASELASTRVATDTTMALVLLAREATPAMVANPLPAAPVVAALTLDDGRRWLGTATWRLDLSAAKAPKLIVDVSIPEKRFNATLSLVKSTTSGNAAYSSAIRFGAGETGSPVAEMRPPQFCDAATCVMPMSPDAGFDGSRFGSYAFGTPLAWGDALMAGLSGRFWIDLPVRTSEGWGKVTISLTGAASVPAATWEHLCCGVAMTGGLPRPVPDPALPVLSSGPVAKPAPQTTALASAAAPRYVDDRTRFDLKMPGAGRSVGGTGPLTWIQLTEPSTVRYLSANVLLATTEITAAELHLSLSVRSMGPPSKGRLGFEFQSLATNPSAFGPLATLTMSTILGTSGEPLMLPISSYRTTSSGDYWVSVDVPETGEMPSAVQIEIDDVRGRRLSLALPISGPVGKLLRAAAWHPGGDGS